jgi:hypothetical protein
VKKYVERKRRERSTLVWAGGLSRWGEGGGPDTPFDFAQGSVRPDSVSCAETLLNQFIHFLFAPSMNVNDTALLLCTRTNEV